MPSCHHASVVAFALLLIYFSCMDVALYFKVQGTNISSFPSSPSPAAATERQQQPLFSPFDGFSVKMVMADHASIYLFDPLAHAIDEVVPQERVQRSRR